MSSAIKYVAEITHVREVSLLGSSDLAFWGDELRKEDLVPVAHDGTAQILIIAADAKFKGVRFGELSFSVLVARPEEANGRDASFLIHAFNSSRMFAFCERFIFSAPYHPGEVRLSASFPPSIRLTIGGEVLFRAEMRADASAPPREPSRRGEDGWEGPIFLPRGRRGKDGRGNWFFGKIRGHTETYPFLHPGDAVTLRPSPSSPIFQALIDSHFVGRAWAVRADASHAKSKTYKRSEVFPGSPDLERE